MQQEDAGRNPKEPVTIRLDVFSKAKLQELASEEEGRTVSSLIALAVQEFLDRRSDVRPRLRVRHAALVDTSVLRAFSTHARPIYERVIKNLDHSGLDFVEDRPEWRRLPADLFSGESDLVESVNLLPIFWHVKEGLGSLRLDWVGPFLQLFVGHHIFVRKDLANFYLSREELAEYDAFRDESKTGRDLSLRSLVGWARQSGPAAERRARAIDAMWADSVVGCQLGTDYHIAVRRLSSILAWLVNRGGEIQDPAIPGLNSLASGFQDFRNGTVTAFTGGLLHSAELLSKQKGLAYLIAGPADLQVPSLNTLAGYKGIFDADPGAGGSSGNSGDGKVMMLWHSAVTWFRDDVVGSESDDNLRELVAHEFPDFLNQSSGGHDVDQYFLAVLKSLMRTWVKWFVNPDEARAFLGETVGGGPTAADLVKHYEKLCDLLNPSAQMARPGYDDQRERAFWKFPVLTDRADRFPDSFEAETVRESTSGSSPLRPARGSSGRA